MNIADYITREEYSYRGGGCELDLTAFGYEDEFLSAYQNYLGGDLLGGVGNSCTVEDWRHEDKLVQLANKLSEYYKEQMYELGYIDEYNEGSEGRPLYYPGL
jgi:hypothetical protein